jgi:benzoyl-CoA reductase subunit C
VFPATCDVIRNLSGMWQMLFPEKLVRYLDVPQDFRASLGGAFWRRELEELSAALTERGAAPLTPERLRESIALHNEHRREVGAAYDLRCDQPWKVPSHELYLVMRAGFTIPVDEHTELVRRYRTLAAAEESRRPMDQARVVLTGAFCEQPPLGLIRTLERSGCYIVDDDLLLGHRWIQGDVSVDGDPLAALVTAFLERSRPSAVRFIDEGEKGRDLLERARRAGAEGVLFAAPSFCDPALLDQPMVTAACDRAGMPWTAFKYSENGGQFQVIREQAGTFADSIKLWSEAS